MLDNFCQDQHEVDHTILVTRLADWFGVNEKALDCFNSYLTGRCLRIKLDNCPPNVISLLKSLRDQF